MSNLKYTLLLVGIILTSISLVVGVGYFLYSWGGLGSTLAESAWGGFKLWLGMVVLGYVSYIAGKIVK